MSRVLLVCPEPLGHGQPAGIGIRFLEMARVLLADGHSVVILSPDGGDPGVCAFDSISPASIDQHTARADVAVVQGHAANDLFAHGRSLPTVVDLYDPFIIENLHYFRERGAEVFSHDHGTLMRSLLRGDFFLCASTAQRYFYLGMLLATGRLNPESFEGDPGLESLIAVAPFGVQSPRQTNRSASSAAILFGGIYDWYDPIKAIEAVARARKSLPDITLTFTRHPNPGSTPQGKAAEAIESVRRCGYESFVRFEPWASYDERAAFFDRFALALLTFPQSLETELSMRTRIFDYLWGGLPVITSSAPGTDEVLQRYGAGVIMQDDDPDRIAEAIIMILGNQDRYRQLIEGAGAFVREHQWSATLEPLRRFCRSPRVDKSKAAFAVSLDVPQQEPSILARLKRRMEGRGRI